MAIDDVKLVVNFWVQDGNLATYGAPDIKAHLVVQSWDNVSHWGTATYTKYHCHYCGSWTNEYEYVPPLGQCCKQCYHYECAKYPCENCKTEQAQEYYDETFLCRKCCDSWMETDSWS